MQKSETKCGPPRRLFKKRVGLNREEVVASLVVELQTCIEIPTLSTAAARHNSNEIREARNLQRDIALLNVRQGTEGTEVHPFDVIGPLFQDQEITKALTASSEDALFESLMMRGMLDA
jgi:hypothetical protein